MEFNQLPPGYEGPQKRRTTFESVEEKLRYDARNLIELAQRISTEKGIAVTPESLITRKDDDVDALRRAIAIQLKGKPESESETLNKYTTFIDGLTLADTDKEKLKAMMSSESYQRSVAAAKEMDSKGRIPTHSQIATELMKYSPERLREICEIMEKPTLLIVPETSFDEKLDAMNANKHYTSADGKAQKDLFTDKNTGSPYLNVPRKKKGKVSIVDGIIHPAQLAGVSSRLGERREHLTAKFRAKNMSNIGGDEMAVLLQRSLIEAKETNDNSRIVDNWEGGTGTVTILDPDSLTGSAFVAYARFDSGVRRVRFLYRGPGYEVARARGRASVQVMEF